MFATLVAVGLLASVAGCASEAPVELSEQAIVSGSRDLAGGGVVYVDDVRQWHRDATVDIDGFCSGALVGPNLVVTAAHCFAEGTIPTSVRFSPRNADASVPPPDGPAPFGTPPVAIVPVIGCLVMAQSGLIACGDPATFSIRQRNNDLAVLLLDRRVDHGETGRQTQGYPAIPAEIVPADPACPGSFGVRDAICWDQQWVFHAGYGPVSGCQNPDFGLLPTPEPLIRQVVYQKIRFGSLGVTGEGAIMQLDSMNGLPGDSGGPVYSNYGGGYNDLHPLPLIGVLSGFQATLARPVCIPGLFGDTSDIVVRLTGAAPAAFLGSVLRTMLVTGPGSGWVTTMPLPPIWTGELDTAPRTETELRTPADETADPDGDGLFAVHDNCLGVFNIEQLVSATPLTLTCRNTAGALVTYGCSPTDIDPDPDRDAIPIACDSCPDTPNNGRDCDRNGIDDACEPNSDPDSRIDACDNCDLVANADQTNCNGTAEAFLGRDAVGDACDPVPCASGFSTTAGPTTASVNTTGVYGLGNGANPVDSPLRGMGTGTTGFRWCPCARPSPGNTAAWQEQCRLRADCAIDQRAYLASFMSGWLPMTMSFTTHAPNSSGEIALRMTTPVAMGGDGLELYSGTWNMVADGSAVGAPFFTSTEFNIPGIAPFVHRQATAVLWTSVRSWAEGAPGTGCRAGDSSGCTMLPDTLAGHYWSGAFNDDTSPAGTFLPDGGRFAGLPDFFSYDMCPACASSFPEMFLALADECTTPPCELFGRFSGPASPGGVDLPLSPQLTLTEVLADITGRDWEWARAQQANDTLDVAAVRAIALETLEGGTWLRRVARSPLSGVKYTTLAAEFVDAPLVNVSRYSGALPLLDAVGEVLYFVGGQRSSTTGNPWIQVVELQGGQRQVALRRLWQGEVVAAALDPFMPYLVAIERTASSYNIVRVSLATGEANVVRTYRNTGTRAYQSIVALPDGRFAFLASQVGSGRGAVALTRIVIAGWSSAGFAVQRRAQTAHRLTGPGAVSASDLGISLAGTPRGSSLWRPVGIRYSAFTHGADSDLQPLF